MNNKEKEFYSNQKNWDFSKINYTIEKLSNWDFYKTISNYSNSTSLCLDLGTGGGENMLKYYPEVGYIIATDNSEEMLETAKNNFKNYLNKKVKFILCDNHNLNFPNEMFDLISARHTSINYQLNYNILVKGGTLIIEGVDTKDCIEIKEIFNRGQDFNSKEILSKCEYESLLNVGFQKVELIKDSFIEYYKSKNDLLTLLKKTPIINDFESDKEIEDDLLEKYIKKFTCDKGIKLKREYYGIIAIK